jgi:octaheme c-type cytochrome (tetrathionate reductase family)
VSTRTWFSGIVAMLIIAVVLVAAGCSGNSDGCPDDDGSRPPIDPPIDPPVEPPVYEGHDDYFAANLYINSTTCTQSGCHPEAGSEVMASMHWNWEGAPNTAEGFENIPVGKNNLINNFCIAIPSNEGRCTQCHAGYGYADDTFDFNDTTAIDCLACHDTTGTYAKAPKTAGNPVDTVDLQLVASTTDEGLPSRVNCGNCHYGAGGGDNVKHGDLSSTLNDPTFDDDVHMDATGNNFTCQRCHSTVDHRIAGQDLHSAVEGPAACTDCHASASLHEDRGVSSTYDNHLDIIACQTCHIPAFARSMPTKVDWRWETAGQDIDPIPTDQYGKPTYDKLKGDFVWEMDVQPTIMWHNGTWRKTIIGESDTYTSVPVVLATPIATESSENAKLYPFKRMTGNQPADIVNERILVPHLFGLLGGANPYWVFFDWATAIQDGVDYTGVPYSGSWGFVDTVMYLRVNHEVAPAEDAVTCFQCHGTDRLDWDGLGLNDPFASTPD